MKNKHEYYCSKPFKLDKKDLWYTVVITNKEKYDEDGYWDDSHDARQQLLEDIIPQGIHESMECVYAFPESMNPKDVEKKLEELGYIQNTKLNDDANSMMGLDLDDDEDWDGPVGMVDDDMDYDDILTVYMMIGLPASGKSTYYGQVLDDYKIVSNDICKGNKKKARKQLEDLLSTGNNVVVDDTNYDKKTRKEIFDIAAKKFARVIGIYTYLDKKTCLERNKDKDRANKPDVAIHSIAKKFEEPDIEEGFYELRIVNRKLMQ